MGVSSSSSSPASARAVWQALREQGYTNVRYVEGGMSEWARRGLPLVKPAAR